ncbi:MAG TPA: ATP-grasp domain-containing protein [Acidobacteriaceae bacterium]|nr:ATP-grasp domain-containing protein [Acidobacteriaceae bacterium]
MAKRRILVLGEDSQSFLTVIRSFGRAGIEVHVAWCPLDSPALASRYIHKIHRLPAFNADNTEWISAFQQLFREERFDLVVPTTDSATLPFQLHRRQFEPLVRMCLLPDDVYRICANKDETWELANRLSICVPRQAIVASAQEALDAAATFGYPLVLKPRASSNERNPMKRQKVLKAENEEELLRLAAEMTANGAVLAQENFIGIGVGVEVLCKDGRILMSFQHERVHEPLKGGGSSYRKSVPLSPDLLDATARMMQALEYTGVAMVEFKLDRASGRWILIEINARFWGSLALCDAAGLDFPIALVRLLLDGQEPSSSHYRTGLYCRHWSKDLQWFLSNLRADKSDPTLQTRKLSSLLLEAVNILTLKERSDTLVLSDPRPAWEDLRLFVGEKLFRVLKLLKPFRSLHGSRLRRLYRRAGSVLVLCDVNICRSPFGAEILARRSGKTVISGAIYPKPGRTSPDAAIAAAGEKGVDLAGHRSSLVTTEDLRAADLILIFDRKNWLGLRAFAPELMDRVAFVGAADTRRPLEIADPLGGDIDEFRHCYARIQDALNRLPS